MAIKLQDINYNKMMALACEKEQQLQYICGWADEESERARERKLNKDW